MVEALSLDRGLVGVLTLPAPADERASVGAIIVNSGIVSRIGPHRINVQLSRALAGRGFPTIRLDLSGVGDSLPSSDTRPIREVWTSDVERALVDVAGRVDIHRWVVIGMCTGARIAAEVSQCCDLVTGIVPINFAAPPALIEIPRSRRWRNPRWWRMRFAGSPARRVGAASGLPSEDVDFFGEDAAGIGEVWRRTLVSGVSVYCVYSEFDGHYDFFRNHVQPMVRREGLGEALELKVIKSADHVFSRTGTQSNLTVSVASWVERRYGQQGRGSCVV